jgi:peptide deformylase
MSSKAKSHSRTPPGPDLGAVPGDPGSLALALYPDPILRRRAAEIQSFDEATLSRLGTLAQRMLEVMRQHRGVGLAAPQLGVSVRMFVMNATGNPEDDRIYINPRLSNPHGDEEREEGCLSLPEINSPVLRSLGLRLRARDLTGAEVDETAEGFVARIWQHETDHLDGILILDKMPASVKISHRKKLKELEDQWREAHPQIARPTKKRRFGRRK